MVTPPRTTSILALILLVVGVCLAQHAGRKLVSQVAPEYPPVLKEKMIGGAVKIIAVVARDGTVKTTQIVGGNPALASAAERAVKHWKYSPAPNETSESVTLHFNPHAP